MKRVTLKTPDSIAVGLWNRTPKEARLTFFASVALGFLVHMYMFTNKLPNYDDTRHLFSMDYGTASGRWLLTTVLRWDGPFSTPWLIGTISVLCLGVTACLTVSLFRIRRPLGCIITAAILVSFPTVTATFSYMFTASGYFFGMMLAAFGAYLAVRFRWGILPGAAAIVLSMGIYQSYLVVATVLMVGALLFETLDGERSFQELFLKGVKLAGTLAAALAVYMIVVRITSRLVPLSDYMGISEMGKISLPELPKLILKSYYEYFSVFLRNKYGHHFGFLKYAFLAVGLICAALSVLLLKERRLGAARAALAVALACVYPLAGNLIYVMVPGGNIHLLMVYGMAYILILPIALAEHVELSLSKDWEKAAHAAASWVILLTMALTAYSYAITANEAYLKIDLSLRQCTAFSNRLIERIESHEGYRPGMAIILLNYDKAEEALFPTPEMDGFVMSGVCDFAQFRTCYAYASFLRYYMGFTGHVSLDHSWISPSLEERPEVQAMPLYPEAGSIQIITDDTVGAFAVVKLND